MTIENDLKFRLRHVLDITDFDKINVSSDNNFITIKIPHSNPRAKIKIEDLIQAINRDKAN